MTTVSDSAGQSPEPNKDMLYISDDGITVVWLGLSESWAAAHPYGSNVIDFYDTWADLIVGLPEFADLSKLTITRAGRL